MSNKDDSNVISLRGAPRKPASEPNEALIECLEDLLERAKSGNLQSFIGAGFCDDRNMRCTIFAGDIYYDVYAMLGMLRWLEREYEDRVLDGMPEGQHP